MIPVRSDEGIRLSVPRVYCLFNWDHTTRGQLEADLSVENPTDKALTFDSDGARMIIEGREYRPWTVRRSYAIAPHTTRVLHVRAVHDYIHCTNEVAFHLAGSLFLDGRAVAVAPLKLVAREDEPTH